MRISHSPSHYTMIFECDAFRMYSCTTFTARNLINGDVFGFLSQKFIGTIRY